MMSRTQATVTSTTPKNLEQLRHAVFPAAIGESETGATVPHNFPSVCLVGLGRCGSNIAQDVASLVYNARSFYLNEFNSEEQRKREKEFGPVSWIRRNLRLPNNGARPVFLIEPMVMLGDLDKDIDGRIRHSNRSGEGGSLRDYAKMRVMDLSEIHQDHPQQEPPLLRQLRVAGHSYLSGRLLRHQGQPVPPLFLHLQCRGRHRLRHGLRVRAGPAVLLHEQDLFTPVRRGGAPLPRGALHVRSHLHQRHLHPAQYL